MAESLDRLSRDQEHVAALYKQLSFQGVLLLTIGEGEISELHVGLKGAMSALYLKDLAQKTRRGLEGRIRQGRSAGGLSYGYRIVRGIGRDGAPSTGERQIDENEADVVCSIFATFAAGKSPRAIAKDLNDRGILGPRGVPWGASTIYGNQQRGTGILNNELYVGRPVWNRQRFVKDPEMIRRQARPNPREEWVVEESPGPAHRQRRPLVEREDATGGCAAFRGPGCRHAARACPAASLSLLRAPHLRRVLGRLHARRWSPLWVRQRP